MTAYLIADIDVTDSEAYSEYAAQTPALIKEFRGRFIVRGGSPEALEGQWNPSRLAVVEFPSKEQAQAFIDDPRYQAIAPIRRSSTVSHLVLVDGCD